VNNLNYLRRLDVLANRSVADADASLDMCELDVDMLLLDGGEFLGSSSR
jgi:hypothetical protein